jgi:CBS domain-containing protein
MTTTMIGKQTVGELMTREPVALSPQDSVALAARLMDELNVGALPVCENWEVRGLLTDRDITVRVIAAGLDPAATLTADVMTDRVRCASARQSVNEVLATMGTVQIRRLPVLDDHGRLVGMVTLGDLAAQGVPGVADALRDISTPSAPDRPAAASTAPEPALA